MKISEAIKMLVDRIRDCGDSEITDLPDFIRESAHVDPMDKRLDALKALNARARNTLNAAELRTVRDLVAYDKKYGVMDLLKFHNVGINTLYHIRDVLDKNGYEKLDLGIPPKKQVDNK